MKKFFLVFITVVYLSPSGFGAQKLDLQAFLSLVRQRNIDVQLAEKNLEMVNAVKKEAWATVLPKLYTEVSYNRNLLTNFIYIDMPDFKTGEMTTQRFKISFNNEYRLNTILSQPIFSFKIGNALRAAYHYEKTSRYAYQAQIQAILTQAKKAFFQVLLFKKMVQVAEAAENNAHENYLNVKNKYANGLASQFELLQAEGRWKSLIPETAKVRRNYDLASNNLKTLAGIADQEKMEIIGELEYYPSLPDSMAFSTILNQRPDYQALFWEKKLRENAVQNERASSFPNLDASVIYMYSAISDYFKLERENKNIIVGLNLHIPIYSGGYTGAQVQKAKIELAKTDLKIQQTERLILNQIRNIYLRLRESHQRNLSARMNLTTVEKAYHIAQISADNGLATQLELKDARVLYDQTKLGYYSAIFDYLSAYFDWQLATGTVPGQ